MKTFLISAMIHSLYALPAPRQLVSGNGQVRHITHRVLIRPTKAIQAALDECAQHETANQKPVSFGLVRQDGLIAIDLDQFQLSMLTRSGYRIDQLVKAATGATLKFTVDLRLAGDEVLNVRTGETIEIESNHAVIQAPEIVLNENISQRLRIEDSVAAQIASAMMAGLAPSATQTQAAPAAPSGTSTAGEEFPEKEVPAGTLERPAPVRRRDQRAANPAKAAATARNTQVKGNK